MRLKTTTLPVLDYIVSLHKNTNLTHVGRKDEALEVLKHRVTILVTLRVEIKVVVLDETLREQLCLEYH